MILLFSVLCSVKEALDLVKEAIGRTGHDEKIKMAIDVAATEFCIGDALKYSLLLDPTLDYSF